MNTPSTNNAPIHSSTSTESPPAPYSREELLHLHTDRLLQVVEEYFGHTCASDIINMQWHLFTKQLDIPEEQWLNTRYHCGPWKIDHISVAFQHHEFLIRLKCGIENIKRFR